MPLMPIDLDQHPFRRHVLEQRLRIVLIGHIHPVADAVGARDIHRLAHVATEAFRWNEPKRQLARVQAEMNLGIKPACKLENPHVIGVVGHRGVVVFAADEIDPRHARIDRRQLEAEKRLGEHALLRRIAEDLIDVARFDLTGGTLIRCPAMPMFAPERVSLVEEGAGGGNVVQQALRHKLVFE